MLAPDYPQQEELVLIFVSETDSPPHPPVDPPQQSPFPPEDSPQQPPAVLEVPQQPPVFFGCAIGIGRPWMNPPFCFDLSICLPRISISLFVYVWKNHFFLLPLFRRR
jgi:hypothetical protein